MLGKFFNISSDGVTVKSTQKGSFFIESVKSKFYFDFYNPSSFFLNDKDVHVLDEDIIQNMSKDLFFYRVLKNLPEKDKISFYKKNDIKPDNSMINNGGIQYKKTVYRMDYRSLISEKKIQRDEFLLYFLDILTKRAVVLSHNSALDFFNFVFDNDEKMSKFIFLLYQEVSSKIFFKARRGSYNFPKMVYILMNISYLWNQGFDKIYGLYQGGYNIEAVIKSNLSFSHNGIKTGAFYSYAFYNTKGDIIDFDKTDDINAEDSRLVLENTSPYVVDSIYFCITNKQKICTLLKQIKLYDEDLFARLVNYRNEGYVYNIVNDLDNFKNNHSEISTNSDKLCVYNFIRDSVYNRRHIPFYHCLNTFLKQGNLNNLEKNIFFKVKTKDPVFSRYQLSIGKLNENFNISYVPITSGKPEKIFDLPKIIVNFFFRDVKISNKKLFENMRMLFGIQSALKNNEETKKIKVLDPAELIDAFKNAASLKGCGSHYESIEQDFSNFIFFEKNHYSYKNTLLKGGPLQSFNVSHELQLVLSAGYDFKRLIYYYYDCCLFRQGITRVSASSDLLFDYYTIAKSLRIRKIEKYPKSLKLSHDVLSYRNSMLQDYKVKTNFDVEIKRDEYKQYVSEHIKTNKDVYSILSPASIDDLVREGSYLDHCVGSYAERVVSQNCKIYFLRKDCEIGVPWVTIAVTPLFKGDFYISMVKGVSNTDPPSEAVNAILKWAKDKDLKVSDYYISTKVKSDTDLKTKYECLL